MWVDDGGGWSSGISGVGAAAAAPRRNGLLLPTAPITDDVEYVRVFAGDVVGEGESRNGSRLCPAGSDLRTVARRLGGEGGAGGGVKRRGGRIGFGAGRGDTRDGPPVLPVALTARRGGARGKISGSNGSGSTTRRERERTSAELLLGADEHALGTKTRSTSSALGGGRGVRGERGERGLTGATCARRRRTA